MDEPKDITNEQEYEQAKDVLADLTFKSFQYNGPERLDYFNQGFKVHLKIVDYERVRRNKKWYIKLAKELILFYMYLLIVWTGLFIYYLVTNNNHGMCVTLTAILILLSFKAVADRLIIKS